MTHLLATAAKAAKAATAAKAAKRRARLGSLALGLLLASLPACGGDDDGQLGPDGGGDDGATNPNRISGTFAITSIAESSVKSVAIDLSGVAIEAIMPSGERIAGSGGTTGAFEIEGVPEGPYTLRVGDRYFSTTIRRFSLSVSSLGRDDVGRIDIHTPLTVSISGLIPWSDGDTLELFSPSGGFAYIDALGALSADPVPGATSYSGLVDGFLAQSRGEAKSAAGDTMYVSQVGMRQGGQSGESEIREALAGATINAGVDIASGQGSTITGALSAAPATRQLNIEWDAPAFEAMMAEAGPSSPTSIEMKVRLVATPTGVEQGVFAAFPTLASATIASDEAASLTANFGSPFPSHWAELEIDEISALIDLEPGGTSVFVRAGTVSEPGRLAGGAIPQVGPVATPTIDGKDARIRLEAVGESPRVAWSPPSIGSPAGYEVDVFELEPARARVAILYTTEASVAIPPGILEEDSTYFLVIRSRHAPTADLASRPLALAVPSAFAEAATAPFSL